MTTLTYSQQLGESHPFTVKITLKCAMQDPFLVKAMHEQLNPGFLDGNLETHVYSATVRYKGNRYVIYGTYEEWMEFFSAAIDNPIPDA
jgi:hypothetical protein